MKKTKQTFQWNKVTLLSKYLAMVLFISLPFIGFIVGMAYQRNLMPDKKQYIQVNVPTPIPSLNTSTSTPKPTTIPKPLYLLKLPNGWRTDNPMSGVVWNEKNEKIGEIVGLFGEEKTCLDNFAARFKPESMEKKLEQWTENVNGVTWYVAHLKSGCPECDWNLYCTEGKDSYFTMYFSNRLVNNNPNTIKGILSSFSFTK